MAMDVRGRRIIAGSLISIDWISVSRLADSAALKAFLFYINNLRTVWIRVFCLKMAMERVINSLIEKESNSI